ncbi:MAG: BON domain-containing protein [Acidobacteria bacterium]|nr:BON domain-containing protein [Acidobacteriota bacterium]MBV9068136.1 BON domain-containing protein [Acidobacteriota bacterium]MBV9186398.1 BON domain-containing protein [Acidobacteriota bacterium]
MKNLILTLAMTAALVGCSNWNRATPAPLDNAATTAEVKKNLLSDSLTGIDVDTRDGVVTLSGHLPTRDARRTAVHDASKVKGVHRVVDNIAVP